MNFNGDVAFSYDITDGNGGTIATDQSFFLEPVNDAPVVSGVVDLGSMEEDGTFRITAEQLLAKASDVDGDELSVLNLKVAEGQGAITDNNDGTWTFLQVLTGAEMLNLTTLYPVEKLIHHAISKNRSLLAKFSLRTS